MTDNNPTPEDKNEEVTDLTHANDLVEVDNATEVDDEEDLEEDESSPARQNLIWAASLILVFLLGLGSGFLLWARPLQAKLATAEQTVAQYEAAAAQQQTAVAGAQNQEQQQVQRYPVPIDDDPILGSDSATITIIEFSDYECPFCRRWHQEVFPQIQAAYGDQVRFVYRDFPLYSIHPNAGPAAEAANCAGEQDSYWDYHNLLFSNEQLDRPALESYAQQLGLDMNSFTACLDDTRMEQEVEADYNYASELGVRSTPTFFINGLAVVGAQPFEVFQQIIDMELAGEIP